MWYFHNKTKVYYQPIPYFSVGKTPKLYGNSNSQGSVVWSWHSQCCVHCDVLVLFKIGMHSFLSWLKGAPNFEMNDKSKRDNHKGVYSMKY